MDKANQLEADQRINSVVVSVVKRTGMSNNRVMATRWILIRQKPDSPDFDKHGKTHVHTAKVRAVVEGSIGPDSVAIRAFLQGDVGECAQHNYGDLPADARYLFVCPTMSSLSLKGLCMDLHRVEGLVQ